MTHALALVMLEIIEQTDKQHPKTTKRIIEELKERRFEISERTVQSCIRDMRDAGYPIETCRCKKYGFFYNGHALSMTEALQLVDSLFAAKDLSTVERAALIRKVEKLTAPSAAKAIRQKLVSGCFSRR